MNQISDYNYFKFYANFILFYANLIIPNLGTGFRPPKSGN